MADRTPQEIMREQIARHPVAQVREERVWVITCPHCKCEHQPQPGKREWNQFEIQYIGSVERCTSCSKAFTIDADIEITGFDGQIYRRDEFGGWVEAEGA